MIVFFSSHESLIRTACCALSLSTVLIGSLTYTPVVIQTMVVDHDPVCSAAVQPSDTSAFSFQLSMVIYFLRLDSLKLSGRFW